MNVKLAVTTIILFIAIFGYAQTGDQEEKKTQKPKFELYYGININDVYDHTDDVDFAKKVSPTLFGLAIHNRISENSELKLELEYSHKGPSVYDINHLTFSPLYRQKILNKSIYLELGPYMGSMFRYKKGGSIRQSETLKTFDFGGQVGFGHNLCIKNLEMSISYQAEIGLYQFSYSKHFVQQIKVGFYL